MSETAPRTWSGPNRTGQIQFNRVTQLNRRLLTVSRIDVITPVYRRIHLQGDDLAAGFPWHRLAVTDHVKILFPQPGTREVTIPERGEHGWKLPEGAPQPIMRDYTVRSWNPDTQELTFDFVIHEHGIAGCWAGEAQVGDQLGVLGPRGNVVLPENYAHYLAFGDETALPSIQRLIEELPDEASIEAYIQVETAAGRQELGARPGLQVTWINRQEQGAGSLAEAARNAPQPAGDDWFVLAAGEVSELKPIRGHFRNELGLPKERVMVSGYWQRGDADFDHHKTGIED